MKNVFDDPLFNGQWLRALCNGDSGGGGNIGECLATAQRIKEGDAESWYTEWNRTADRIYADAEASMTGGHITSAREAYLRATSYYRIAWFFLIGVPMDSRLIQGYERQAEVYRKAASLWEPAIEAIKIPYEGTTLPGYFYHAGNNGGPRPTLIFTLGYDSTAEECHFTGAIAAQHRGYNCLCFEGPGQGEPLIKQHLYFRPDWENVVRPVVDYTLTRSEVDPQRVALIGRSWGGYLAPRAATAEHRLAACIADPGLYALGNVPLKTAAGTSPSQGDSGTPDELNRFLEQRMQDPQFAFVMRRGMWSHGVTTPLAYMQLMDQYSLKGIAQQITCPTLICQAENDSRAASAKTLYDTLTCPKKFLFFSAEEGAGEHCESGASSLFEQRTFDWLDEVLGVKDTALVGKRSG